VAFVVARVDRIFRDVEMVAHFAKKGYRTVLADMPSMDLRTPTGKLALHQLAAFGEFERELIKDRTEKGRAIAAQNRVGKQQKATPEMSAMTSVLKAAVRPPGERSVLPAHTPVASQCCRVLGCIE
jgi:DNA invertase Pin-like site-specific DNA recombinase